MSSHSNTKEYRTEQIHTLMNLLLNEWGLPLLDSFGWCNLLVRIYLGWSSLGNSQRDHHLEGYLFGCFVAWYWRNNLFEDVKLVKCVNVSKSSQL